MLVRRLLIAILLVPPGIGLIALGGWPYGFFVTLVLGVAAWEYWNLFRIGGFAPSRVLVVGGVAGLALITLIRPEYLIPSIVLLTLAAMTYHLVDYERGRDKAATDFGITLGGILYLGLIGSFLISLRNLPDGKWWVMLVLPSVWLVDTGAYLIGSRYGKHKLSPRLSPKKTWEGFFAGIVFGVVIGAVLAALWHLMSPAVTIERGALIGFLMGVLTPLGDLGESMIKRQAGVKDSSQILPGHGGVLDRIDSWLWAGVIGYYVILLLT
jgi:phosphatidate cytidylyltransferase